MIKLFVKLFFVSHVFANIWVYIGEYELVNSDAGWIQTAYEKGIQKKDFISVYITALYWVITTFSSVGYGDITGSTTNELYVVFVIQMVGIGFFGYMVGIFQTIISGLKPKDQQAVEQEFIDLWLIQLDKLRNNFYLPKNIFGGVKEFYV